MSKIKKNAMGFRLFFVLSASLLLTGTLVTRPLAEEGEGTSRRALSEGEAAYHFADRLMEEGDYNRAVTEFKRSLFLQPDHPLADSALFNIGTCHFLAGEWEEALLSYRETFLKVRDDEIRAKSLYMMGESDYRGEDYEAALSIFRQLIDKFPNGRLAEMASYKAGWSLVMMGRWGEASQEFSRIGEGSDLYPSAKELKGDAGKGGELPHKRPIWGGILSAIIPGAGQLYAGRYRDALVSFLLNLSFILAAVKALRTRNYALALILILFEVGWFTGNIYGAMGGAHKYNAHVREEFIQGLISSHKEYLDQAALIK